MTQVLIAPETRIVRVTLRQSGTAVANSTPQVVRLTQPVVKIQRVVQRGEQGLQGPPGNVLPAIYFSYGDATPAIVTQLENDLVIVSVSLSVQTAFDGVGAKVSLGIEGDAELLMKENESDLAVVSTYETQPFETMLALSTIKAFITPGAGATQGRCMILIEYALP